MLNTEELKQFNQSLIEEFRANRGRVSGWEDQSLLLLTTSGAKSGQPHTTPLAYIIDGERLIVFAANQGAPNHPHWYHNLVVNPEVTVEVGSERWQMRARIATGLERERLFNQRAEQWDGIVEYQQRSRRHIPVVILERGG